MMLRVAALRPFYVQVGGRRRAQQCDRRGRRLRSREEMLLGEAVVGAQGYVAVVEHPAQAMPWLSCTGSCLCRDASSSVGRKTADSTNAAMLLNLVISGLKYSNI